jgi:hypothetical protein
MWVCKGLVELSTISHGSITDHIWSVCELLRYKVAPSPWVEPKRRGRPRKEAEPILLALNDRAGVPANILSLIRLCPNGHAGVLARSLEHFHRLVELYQSKVIK